jgi:hypothetical protein
VTTWWNAHPRERQRVFAVTGIAFAVIAASGLGIAKLVDDVFGGDGATRVDPTITNYVVDHRTAALTTMARGVTHLADPLLVTIVAVISVVALLARRRRRLAGFVALSMAGAALATSLGKLVVDRPRPSDTIWLTRSFGRSLPLGPCNAVRCVLVRLGRVRRDAHPPAFPPTRVDRARRRRCVSDWCLTRVPRRPLDLRRRLRLGCRDSVAPRTRRDRLVQATTHGRDRRRARSRPGDDPDSAFAASQKRKVGPIHGS